MENKTIGNKRKVVLVNASTIMRDMLIRAIEGNGDGFQIDREILKCEDLVNAQENGYELDADWIIAVETDSIIPQPILHVSNRHPRTKLLVLAADGSKVVLRWFEEKTRVVDRLDLPDLMEILRSHNNGGGHHK